jgi:hypothetical protein
VRRRLGAVPLGLGLCVRDAYTAVYINTALGLFSVFFFSGLLGHVQYTYNAPNNKTTITNPLVARFIISK